MMRCIALRLLARRWQVVYGPSKKWHHRCSRRAAASTSASSTGPGPSTLLASSCAHPTRDQIVLYIYIHMSINIYVLFYMYICVIYVDIYIYIYIYICLCQYISKCLYVYQKSSASTNQGAGKGNLIGSVEHRPRAQHPPSQLLLGRRLLIDLQTRPPHANEGNQTRRNGTCP